MEKCREAELSPRRRAAAAAASSSPLFSDGGRSSPTPADLYPAVQRLRATGRITVESLRALLGPEDGAFLEVALCAFERVELGARLPPTGTCVYVCVCLWFRLSFVQTCVRTVPSPRPDPTDTDNGEPDDEVFLPGIPIAQSEDDFAVAALLDSPAGAMCDSAGGKVACYYAFREGRLPKVGQVGHRSMARALKT